MSFSFPVFIAGCGYVGLRLAKALLPSVAALYGFSRSAARVAELNAAGVKAAALDLDSQTFTLPSLHNGLLYYFIPPPPQGREDKRLQVFLDKLDSIPQRIVLMSTSGVYGDCGGRWITETETLKPQADRAYRRMDAERRLQAWCDRQAVNYTILRVPGIYGPYRLPRKRLEKALPVLEESLSPYSNRIHVDDLVRACIAAGSMSGKHIIHLSDGHPTTMTDYFKRVAKACGFPQPPQLSQAAAERELSHGMLGYLAESKRLDISAMRTLLGIEPLYPGLDAGLAQCLEEESKKTAPD